MSSTDSIPSTPPCYPQTWLRWLAALWLLAVLMLAWNQWNFWHAPKISTDVFAALPSDRQSTFSNQALQHIAQSNERRIMVLAGANNWEQAQVAAVQFKAHITAIEPTLTILNAEHDASNLIDFYTPWRDALLTDAQRSTLGSADVSALSQQALARLYGLGQMQVTNWLRDPLGLWTDWWRQQSSMTSARPQNGFLRIDDSATEKTYAALLLEIPDSAFRFDGHRRWMDAIELAKKQVHNDLAATSEGANIPIKWLFAGIPLLAEDGAADGYAEMNTIGLGSFIAVIVLTLLAFFALRPIALISLSLAIGCAAGVWATVAVFGEIHVLTIVFGASLVGVAEDFGIHYFASRLQPSAASRWVLMRRLLPGLFMALITSVIGYAVLAIVPFPGLRQMAVFSAVGLIAAFITVVCWFPVLDRAKSLHEGAIARALVNSLEHIPALSLRKALLLSLCVGIVSALAMTQLRVSDDLRSLQPQASELMGQQIEASRLLHLPSMVQFVLVQGSSEQQVLEREEALQHQLAQWQQERPKDIAPFKLQMLSSWIPSIAMQHTNRNLVTELEKNVLSRVAAALDETLERPAFASSALTLQEWLNAPVSASIRTQWLGLQSDGQFASVVLLAAQDNGLARSRDHLLWLANKIQNAQEDGSLQGVTWVDRIADISDLMQHFRVQMSQLLLIGHLLVLLALAWRFGQDAWRAWLPCALASSLCIAILAIIGQPIQLFHILALLLLLGMGVDFGTFMVEHKGKEQGHAWLAVVIGGVVTIHSFGLLGLSKTPALHAFGTTLLIGLPLSVIFSALLRPAPSLHTQAYRPFFSRGVSS
ncbi:hypothetical protein E9531_07890 [Lampropedia puyangensis]|uniref:Membrane transport protein MMPL domain-containing protein n=1 Tax=Lampropedia puyangensis TaxID=1330072 RepID=A0A4S8F7G1_9BURK|nr:hypothetical protein [Lampropedia puyangensis]THU02585.1 hypothetical protein E9531_07890 [Lampropedia puyangensis]